MAILPIFGDTYRYLTIRDARRLAGSAKTFTKNFTARCRFWVAWRLDGLAAEAAEEDEGGGGGGDAPNEEEEQEEGGEEEGGEEEAAASGGPAGRDREAERARRDAARAAQLAEAQARRDARVVAARAATEARRLALPEQLQGRAAGVDLAPAARPRREPRPVDRLIEGS